MEARKRELRMEHLDTLIRMNNVAQLETHSSTILREHPKNPTRTKFCYCSSRSRLTLLFVIYESLRLEPDIRSYNDSR